MKRILIVFLLISSLSSFAQSVQNEVDYYQSLFGMGKNEVVTQLVTLNESNKQAFWQLYDQYEAERKELGKARIVLLAYYADNFGNMTADKLDEIVNESIRLSGKSNKLINTYYKKIKKSVGPDVAAQFYQFEIYLSSEIRAAVFSNIPVVEKLTN